MEYYDYMKYDPFNTDNFTLHVPYLNIWMQMLNQLQDQKQANMAKTWNSFVVFSSSKTILYLISYRSMVDILLWNIINYQKLQRYIYKIKMFCY